MATLEILYDNGRREKVKVQPNTPLLQVLDEVCKKLGLDSSKYHLIHNKKALDLCVLYRYSGLLNNAKLDLAEGEHGTAFSQVALALQLPEGGRMVDNFSVETSLFDVLSCYEASKSIILTSPQGNKQPVCIYAQTEVVGVAALRATSLRSLGLTGGRAGLRFVWKEVSQERLQEIERDLAAQHAKAEKLERRSKVMAAERCNSTLNQPMDTTSGDQSSSNFFNPSADSQNNEEDVRLRSVFDDGPVVSAFGNHGRQRSMFDTESNKKPQEKPRAQSMFLSGQGQHTQPPNLQNFKFPEESKGQDLYRNELTEKGIKNLTEACDREAVLYEVAEAKAANEEDEELPDDFYEVTKEDLQVMHNDLMRQTNFSISSQAAKRYERYERAIVRVHIPSDGVVLQAVFQPTEPVYSLLKFVKENVTNGDNVVLYTPPRRVITEANLREMFASAGMLPAVNVYLSSRQKDSQVHITEEARAKLKAPFAIARSIVSKWVTAAISNEGNAMDVSVGLPRSPSIHQSASPTEESSIRPPKWFRIK